MLIKEAFASDVDSITVEHLINGTEVERVELYPETHPDYFSDVMLRVGEEIYFDGKENIIQRITARNGKIFVVAYL